jgi:preprotein translocase subunit SecG
VSGSRGPGTDERCDQNPQVTPCSRHGNQCSSLLSSATVLQILVFFHLVVSVALVGLVLMHSGRDTGMAGMGFVPASQGGTHIVERNLTRLTIGVGVVFFVNTVLLYRMLA